ncbi:MAG: glycosyltransferase [Gemmatimonas sp.]
MAESGGTELNAVRTVEHLPRDQVTPVVLTLNGHGAMGERYQRMGVRVVEFPIHSLVGLPTWRRQTEAVRFLREERIQIVHAHDLYSNFFFGLAARRAGTPVVIASKRWTRQPKRRHFFSDMFAYRFAHRVLANSEAVADSLHTTEHIAPSKVWVLENFIEPEVFAPVTAGERRARREVWGIPMERRLIGIVARLRSEKDHATFIRAGATLMRDHRDVDLAIVGDGPEESALRALADTLGIAGRVHFLGHQPSRPTPHSLFDLSVLCSLHEGFPNSVIESMASGTAVIATRVGAIPDILGQGALGWLVPPADPVALAGAMREALADPGHTHQVAQAARRASAERFSATATIARLVRWYHALLAQVAPSMHGGAAA